MESVQDQQHSVLALMRKKWQLQELLITGALVSMQ